MKGFDIETLPNINLVDCLPEPERRTDWKDPVKIERDFQEKKQKQIDSMALSPLFGRICSYSIWSPEKKYYDVIDEISDAAELALIERALEHFCITSRSVPELCTWNGFNFDIPFLFKRAMILKCTLPSGCPGARYFLKKYTNTPHCDVAQELSNWQPNGYMSLDTAASVILGENKLEHDFTKFIGLIESGRGAEIGVYNLRDSELTYRIWDEARSYIF